MLTRCTNAESITHGWDLAAISIIETGLGIDMPCAAMAATGTTLLGLLLTIPTLGLALALQNRIGG